MAMDVRMLGRRCGGTEVNTTDRLMTFLHRTSLDLTPNSKHEHEYSGNDAPVCPHAYYAFLASLACTEKDGLDELGKLMGTEGPIPRQVPKRGGRRLDRREEWRDYQGTE
jgi:hypothetical protein